MDAFLDRRPAHSSNAICFRLRYIADQDQRKDHCQVGNGIDVIHGLLSAKRNRKTRQRRAEDGARLPGDGGHAEGVGQILCRNQVGHQSLSRRSVECNCNGLKRSQHIDVPDRDLPKLRQQAQSKSKDRGATLGNKKNSGAVK